jgi:hypothetical protein
MRRPFFRGTLALLSVLGVSFAHAVVDHYVVTAPSKIMKGDSGISFSIDPQNAANVTDATTHRVLFVLPLGVTVEGASGTGDATSGWEVSGVTNFTVRTSAVASVGFFDLRVKDKFDPSVFGFKTIQVEPTIVSYELSPPFAPFTGRAGEGFILSIRALGPGGVTVTSYSDNVRLSAAVGDLSITSGGAADTVFGATFINGVAEVIVILFGTDPLSRQNTITANQVDTYVGQPTPATGLTSPALTINPNVYDHILLRFPGESLTPGTGSGKVGAATGQIAGASINPVYVDLVDQWHNPINPADNAGIYPLTVSYSTFFVGALPDVLPAASVLAGVNQANVSFTMSVAGTHLIQADAGGGDLSQSNVPVVADAGFRLRVTPDPMPPLTSAVTPFLMTVEAVDVAGNVQTGYNGTAVVIADNCSGTLFGDNTVDSAPGAGSPGAQNTITFSAGRWANRPMQVFKASNLTRLIFTDASAGLSGNSTCFDNDPGGAAQLLFTLPGQTYTPGAYPGNLNNPLDMTAGNTLNAVIRVTDLSWNQIGVAAQPLTVYIDNAVGFIDALAPQTMGAAGDATVNNIRLRTSSFRPLAAAVPQVLQAQIATPNIHGESSPIVVNPGAYTKMVLAAPTETLSPGNPSAVDGKVNTISTQSFNVAFPMQVYLTDSLFNPVQAGPYAGSWPSIQFSVQGGGDVSFPATNPAPMATSLLSFAVTSRKMDTNTIVATDTVNPARFAQVSLAVQAGVVSKFVVSPDPDPLDLLADPIPIQTAGVPFTLAFKAYDQFNNLATNFGGSVNLELWEDGVPVPYAGTISPSTINFVANPVTGGVSTASITITYAGPSMGPGPDQLQVRAFINSPTREGFSASFSVQEVAWADIVLTRSGESLRPGLGAPFKTGAPTPVLAGNSLPVTLTAVDVYGNQVDQSGIIADLSILTSGVYANLGSPAQVTVTNGLGNGFIQIYTAGSSVLLASVTASGFNDRSTGTITTGSYSASTGRLVVLAPGEVLLPGSPSAPGKDSSGITPIEANTSMAYSLYACDRYYNRDTTYSGSAFSLASDDGAINLTDLAVNSGSTTVSSVFLKGHVPNPSTVRVTATDQNDVIKTSYSDVPVTPGATYVVTVPTSATVGVSFPITVDLIDPDTGDPMLGANNAIAFEALTSSGGVATVSLGVAGATLSDGTVTLDQSYSYVETIKIRVTDSFNRVAESGNITVVPNGLKYKVSLPATSKTTDDIFSVTVGLYDTVQDLLPIRSSSYQHSFNVSVEAGGLPAVGSAPLTTATLTDGEATFNFSYTKAEHIVVRASGTLAGYPSIVGIDDMDITPGAYVKVQILAPGEVAVPGVPSLTGKNSSGLLPQAARESFSLTVNAVDRHWNVVTSLNTPLAPSVQLTASDGSLTALVVQGFSNGQALFSGVRLNTPPAVTVEAEDTSSVSLFPQSVVIPVTGRAYVAVVTPNFPPNFYSGPPRDFDVDLSLYRFTGGSTGAIVSGYSGNVTIEPMTISLQPLSADNVVVVSPPIPDISHPNVVSMDPSGLLNLTLAYRVAEDIVLKFTDADGWQGFSEPIHFIPRDVDYVVTTPVESRVGPPDTFSMTITPKDADTGTTAKNWSRTVTVAAVSPAAIPVTGTLQVTSLLVDGGASIFQQAFSQAGVFYFTVSDGVKTSTSAAMNFLPGPLASLTTDIPATIEAGSTQTVHVTLMDAFDNPIPNLTLAFALSDASFGTLSTLTGVSNVVGQSATVFATNGQKSGLGSFTGTSGSVSVRQAFRLLGPPSTSLRVDGLGIEEGKGYAVKPRDPIFMDIAVESGTALVSVSYSVNGGPLQTSVGPFDLLPSGLYTFKLPIGTLDGGDYVKDVGRYTVDYYGTTLSGLTHSETAKTSKTFFVSAETTAEEGLVNYPNPFRAGQDLSFLEYVLTSEAGVRLTIYDMMGQRVYERSYSQGEVGGSAGLNRISWDGKNNDGEVVGNGGYVAVLEVSGGPKMRRKIAVKK